jgi:hypothetical protein
MRKSGVSKSKDRGVLRAPRRGVSNKSKREGPGAKPKDRAPVYPAAERGPFTCYV